MKKCPSCAYKNADDAEICNLCSGKLPKGGWQINKSESEAVFAMFEPRGIGGARRGIGIDPKAPPQAAERPAPVANVVRYFLIPAVGGPVKLEPGATQVIGRDETAGIRIQSPKVSRKHSEIRWQGPRPAIVDLGSQNGTKVNGTALASGATHVLADRDEVEVGGIVVRYRVLQPGQPDSDLAEPVAATTLVAGDQDDQAELVGNAAILPIEEVVERLEKLGASGLLVVEAGGAKGALRIEGGKPVAGSFAGLEGDPAIAAVRSLTRGRFRFEAQDEGEVMEVVVPATAPPPPSKAKTIPLGPRPGPGAGPPQKAPPPQKAAPPRPAPPGGAAPGAPGRRPPAPPKKPE